MRFVQILCLLLYREAAKLPRGITRDVEYELFHKVACPHERKLVQDSKARIFCRDLFAHCRDPLFQLLFKRVKFGNIFLGESPKLCHPFRLEGYWPFSYDLYQQGNAKRNHGRCLNWHGKWFGHWLELWRLLCRNKQRQQSQRHPNDWHK